MGTVDILYWIEKLALSVAAFAIFIPLLFKLVLTEWRRLVLDVKGKNLAPRSNKMVIEITKSDGTSFSITIPPEGMSEEAVRRFVEIAKEATNAEAETIPSE